MELNKFLKIFFSICICLLLNLKSSAQTPPLVVTDAVLNKQLKEQTKKNALKVQYENLKTAISKGALKEAFTITKQVTSQYSLINEVYTATAVISNLRKYKIFYQKVSAMNYTIQGMANYLAKKSDKEIGKDEKKMITKGMREALSEVQLANEFVSFSMDPSNSLSLRERLAQIDEANTHLSVANQKIALGVSIIKEAEIKNEVESSRDKYYKLKYN